MKSVVAIIATLFCVALVAAQGPLPSFPSQYYIKGVFSIPYFNITEPIEVWYDGINNRQVITYYDRTNIVIQLPNATYAINPEVRKLTCQAAYGPSGPLVELLPSLQGYSMIGEAVIDGIQVQNWNFPINNLSAGAGYSMYLTSNNVPVQLRIDGVDFVFDSHPDVYLMDYGLYLPGYTDETVFEVPPICANARSVSMKQLQRGFAGKVFSAMKGGETCETLEEHDEVPSSVEKQFREFLAEYNKEYNCPEEYQRRLAIFTKTLNFIETHNNDPTKSHKVGLNHFADLSDEEFNTLITPTKGRPENNGAHSVHKPKLPRDQVPDSVDWVSAGAVGKVKDQGVCGSCYSFGSTGSLEGVYQIATGQLPSLSEQQIVDCSWSEGPSGNQGCGGGFASTVYQWIIDNGGIATEKSYPYLMQDGWCRTGADYESGVTISSYVNVTSGEDNLQEAIASVGPVAVAIDASHPEFRYYRSGVYFQPNCGNTLDDLDHGKIYFYFVWIFFLYYLFKFLC
eukprot:TRINITY_DN1401_c0_g1_i2.p1 TRINITY_DN1401_c0_g1~~TRINITY_DN1401_c0_g1_i2.p1  ORF type:complete len:520 (+),score=133.00 TRINITY_DN1401_c0_g1_i2:30-1562(+)